MPEDRYKVPESGALPHARRQVQGPGGGMDSEIRFSTES